MTKSADAFRTISEVADWLGVQPHVLRFWESKFTQVKPVKRAGGRRYYRPNDMLLLGGIRKLLHEDGLTIKGVQKIIREEGMAHVADLSPALDEELGVIDFDAPSVSTAPDPDPNQADMFSEPVPQPPSDQTPVATPAVEAGMRALPTAQPDPDEAPMIEDAPQEDATVTHLPRFMHKQPDAEDTKPASAPKEENEDGGAAAPTARSEPISDLPSFLTDSPEAPPAETDNTLPGAQQQPAPRIVDAPDPDESTITTAPSALTAAIRTTRLTAAQRQQVLPLIARLAAHRDQLAASSARTDHR